MAVASSILAAGALGTGVAGAVMGGGGGGENRYKLPPELEMQFLNNMQAEFGRIEESYNRARTLEMEFNDRLATIDAMINGTIPAEEGIKALQESTVDLAKAFGGNAQELIDSGFLTPDVAKEMEDLRALESADLKDPALENKLNDERAALRQQLQRQGVSPAQIQQAMTKFDMQAEEQRFTRAEQLRSGKTERGLARISSAIGARESGFGQAMQAYGAGASALDQLFQQRAAGISGLMQTSGARFDAGGATEDRLQALRGERQQQFTTAGQFDFSAQARDALEGGFVGPGTMYEQTGVARRNVGGLKDVVAEWEKAQTKKDIEATRAGYTRNRTQDLGMYGERTKKETYYDPNKEPYLRRS